MPSPNERSARLVSEFASDPDMAELVDLFVTELPTRVAALDAAWSGKRIPDLTRLAHQLKGAGAGYGFPTIGTAAGALESRLKQLDATGTQSSIERLAVEYRELLDLCARACQKG
jgi:histidine phosphotransfer protein HptB